MRTNIVGRFWAVPNGRNRFRLVVAAETAAGTDIVDYYTGEPVAVSRGTSVATAAMGGLARDALSLRGATISREEMAAANPLWKSERDMTLESFIATHHNTRKHRDLLVQLEATWALEAAEDLAIAG